MSRIILGSPMAGGLIDSLVNRKRVFTAEPRNHLITVGSARSGKGAASIAINALTWPGSMALYDPKLENCLITAEQRLRMGQRVIALDPWRRLERVYLSGAAPGALRFPIEIVTDFNPLNEVDPRSDDYESSLTDIADAAVDRANAQKDPHWDDQATELIGALLADCLETGEPNLPAMRRRLMRDREGFLALVAEAKAREPYLNHGGKSAAYFLSPFTHKNKEMQSIFSSARRHTKFLDDRVMARHFMPERNSFRLADIANQPTTLYLGLPPDKLDAYYPRWIRVMLIMLITAIIRARPAHNRVLLLLDEFATALGRIPIVERQFGLGAGLGLILWPYVQSLAQLRGVYGEGYETFLGNATIKQFFACGDQFTAEYVSRLLGSYRRPTVTRSWNGHNASVSMGESWDQVMRPEEVRRFLAKHSIAFVDEVPYRLNPMFYFKEPRFAGQYRTPPEYAPREAAARPAQETPAPRPGRRGNGFIVGE